MVPQWYARFAIEEFPDRETLCQGILVANFFDSRNLIDLLSCRLACELINNPDYLPMQYSNKIDIENTKIQ